MAEFEIKCADGCGEVLGRVTLPDGAKYPGDTHYGFMVPEHAEIRAAAMEAEQKARTISEHRRQIEEVMGSGFVLVDDDPLDLQPGIWKRITDLFRR